MEPQAQTPATIRPAKPDDMPQVAEIYAHYVHTTVITFDLVAPPVETWRAKLTELDQRCLPFLVAEIDGSVAGFAYAGPFRAKAAYDRTVEDTIYLDPRFTGRGLGSQMLSALIAEATRAGLRQMIAVITRIDNTTSPRLHRKFGFVDIGCMNGVGFKHGAWLDVLLMQRDLTQPEA